jgi:hypothetical protein
MKIQLPPSYSVVVQSIKQSSTFSQAVTSLHDIMLDFSRYDDHHTKYNSWEEFIARNVMRSLNPLQAAWNVKRLNLLMLGERQDTMNSEERCVYVAIMLRSMCVSAEDGLISLVSCGSHVSDNKKKQFLATAYGNWDTAVRMLKRLRMHIIEIFDQDTQDYIKIIRKTGAASSNSCCM